MIIRWFLHDLKMIQTHFMWIPPSNTEFYLNFNLELNKFYFQRERECLTGTLSFKKINKTFCYSTQLLLTWMNVFVFFSLQTTLGGFKPSISGFWVEYSTTLLSGHNQSVQKTRETFKIFLNAFPTYKLTVSFLVAHKSWEYRLALFCLVQRGMNIVFLPM
jgi:hypothetical protein